MMFFWKIKVRSPGIGTDPVNILYCQAYVAEFVGGFYKLLKDI